MRNVMSRRRGIDLSAGVREKFGNSSGDRRVEFEQAAFVEDRGHGCGGDCFGD